MLWIYSESSRANPETCKIGETTRSAAAATGGHAEAQRRRAEGPPSQPKNTRPNPNREACGAGTPAEQRVGELPSPRPPWEAFGPRFELVLNRGVLGKAGGQTYLDALAHGGALSRIDAPTRQLP